MPFGKSTISSSSSSVDRMAKFRFFCGLLLNWRPPVPPAPDGLKLTRRVFFVRCKLLPGFSPRSSCSGDCTKCRKLFHQKKIRGKFVQSKWRWMKTRNELGQIKWPVPFTSELVSIESIVIVPDSVPSAHIISSRHFDSIFIFKIELNDEIAWIVKIQDLFFVSHYNLSSEMCGDVCSTNICEPSTLRISIDRLPTLAWIIDGWLDGLYHLFCVSSALIGWSYLKKAPALCWTLSLA